MPKTNLKDIFKNGESFKLKEIDFNSRRVKKIIAECKKEQEKCLRRKEIDWNKLNNFYITI